MNATRFPNNTPPASTTPPPPPNAENAATIPPPQLQQPPVPPTQFNTQGDLSSYVNQGQALGQRIGQGLGQMLDQVLQRPQYYPPNQQAYYPPNQQAYYPPNQQAYYPPNQQAYYPPNQQAYYGPRPPPPPTQGPPPTQFYGQAGPQSHLNQGQGPQFYQNQGPPPAAWQGPPPPLQPMQNSPKKRGGAFRKLGLLLWKNLLYRRRHYIITTLEILLPTILALCLALLFHTKDPTRPVLDKDSREFYEYQRHQQNHLRKLRSSEPDYRPSYNEYILVCNNGWRYTDAERESDDRDKVCEIAYSPAEDDAVERVIDRMHPSTGLVGPGVTWTPESSEREVEKYAARQSLRQMKEAHIYAAIIFDNDLEGVLQTARTPEVKTFRYSLRTGRWPTFDKSLGRSAVEYELQFVVEKALLGEFVPNERSKAVVHIQNYTQLLNMPLPAPAPPPPTPPKPPPSPADKKTNNGGGGSSGNKKTATQSINSQALRELYDPDKGEFGDKARASFAAIFVGMGFVFIVPAIMKGVVNERETGIKELMKLSGIPNWIHWVAWTINFVTLFTITVTLVCLILFLVPQDGEKFIWNCEFFLFWLLLWLYVFASTTFCFFLSSFFPRPIHAITIGIIFWLMTSVGPSAALLFEYDFFSTGEKMAMALAPNAALFFIFRIVLKWESLGEPENGAHWRNLFETDAVESEEDEFEDTLTLGLVGVMLVVDIVVYFLLTLYFEAILPSEYGLRRPFYFLFTPSFWGCGKKAGVTAKVGQQDLEVEDKPGFEREPEDLTIGVEIKNMRKIFGKYAAVDGVSLKMFQGEIFALLGHNGAGKTTTISCCTGMMAPTSGTAIIDGFDIVSQMDLVREQLGVCPQHNLIFDELTVDQHLKFFGKLKGMSSESAKQERVEMLRKLQLTEKTDVMAKKLSGGQKRKLCLGIALIGEAKVVFLDEPTSGMDVEARRAIWDLLLFERGHRTIILTTHFMEEADVLGDRIGIMAHGKVQCCGTSLFLKRYYGTGYTLTMTMTDKSPEKWNDVLLAVQVFVSTATFKEDANNAPGPPASNQLDINLPTEDCSTVTFSILFKSLQEQKQKLGIQTFGLSLTTMDEVFIKVDEAYSLKSGKVGLVPVPSVLPSRLVPPPPTTDNPEIISEADKDHVNEKSVEDGKIPLIVDDPKITASVNPSQPPNNPVQNAKLGENLEGRAYQERAEVKTVRFRGVCLVLIQFIAFVFKRFHYTRRKWKLFLCQVTIPLLLTIIAVYCGNATLPVSPQEHEDSDIEREQTKGFASYPNISRGEWTYYVDDRTVKTFGNQTWQEITNNSGKALVKKYSDQFEDAFTREYNQYPNPSRFLSKHVVALHLTDTEIRVYFAEEKYKWLALNMGNNLFLRVNGINVRLEMTEGPPLLDDIFIGVGNITDSLQESPVTLLYNFPIFGLFLTVGLALLAASFVVAPIEEKMCSAKQLQLMTGVSPAVYWMATFFWDFVLMTLVILMMLVTIVASQRKEAYTDGGAGVLFLILIVFAYAAIPFSYLFTLFSGSVSGGFGFVTSIHVLMILLGFVSGSFMEGAEIWSIYTVASTFRVFGSIFPCFGLTMCLVKYVAAALRRSKCHFLPKYAETYLCSEYNINADFATKTLPIDKATGNPVDIFQCCAKCEESYADYSSNCVSGRKYLEWEMHVTSIPLERGQVIGLSGELLFLFILGTIYHIILLVWEVCIAPRSFGGEKQAWHEQNKDDDVENEAQRVMQLVAQGRVGEDALVVHNLTKSFGTFAAVKDVNFGLHHGECFGLLGVNGAGKTTIFRMLTGDESRTSGNAFASGCNLKSSKTRFLGKIGYCPQFDGIVGVLTGLEMVRLFGRLRGVKGLKAVSKSWMARVGLTENENEQCGRYSGGMKRRLSAAMALIGDPEIVLLDEPTTGVDPVSRRQFWKIILSTKAEGRAVILTSHSMDEIAACCTRLAIMVNGQLQCLGGVQYLKNKFAQGFSLELKLTSSGRRPQGDQELASLHSDILEKLAPCSLKDSHSLAMQYHIEDPLAPWDVLFSRMEEIKAKYPTLIEDYTISETTLEQVFLAFARMQYPARTAPGGGICSKCFG